MPGERSVEVYTSGMAFDHVGDRAEGFCGNLHRRLAAGLGLTTMSTYRHFPNCEALLDAIAEREFAALASDPAAWHGDPEDVAPALAHLDLALSEPHLYTFLFTEPRSGARRFPHDMRAGLSPTLNTVVAGLCEGRHRGTFSFTDEWEVALIIAAEVHGLVQLLHGGRLAMEAVIPFPL